LVASGTPIAQCGNSGNSTEPHVHVQATDSADWFRANGLPITFSVDPTSSADPKGGTGWLPRNREPFVVD
jgi:murein DD-endopeptidase MepM/ murein hydrolase activator NlpD